jgi:hypothetical protein
MYLATRAAVLYDIAASTDNPRVASACQGTTMDVVRLVCGVAVSAGFAAPGAGCGASPAQPSPFTSDPVTLSLEVTGDPLFPSRGESHQFSAMLLRPDRAPQDVTAQATWRVSNGNAVDVSAGLVEALRPGGADVSASYLGYTATVRAWVAALEDCIPYDSDGLMYEAVPATVGNTNWVVASPFLQGFILHATFASEAAARRAILLMQRYREECFVGRGNQLPDRSAYIVRYWQALTGLQTTIDGEDCEAYDPAALAIGSLGAAAWAVQADGREVARLASEADAVRVLLVAREHGSRCFIGRGNGRLEPERYVMGYWQ